MKFIPVSLLVLALLGCAYVATNPAPPAPTATHSALLPDRSKTPGAVNPDVTPDTLSRTICAKGWTATVRPPEAVTEKLKNSQLASGYNYNGDLRLADYEEDHLIPLEIGGATSDPANLWPQPKTVSPGSLEKDKLENTLNHLVCSGKLPLATAQQEIATDWWAAYQKYLGS